MKKIGLLCALLFCFLLGCFRLQIHAATDTEPPTVTWITLSKTSVTAPGQIKVTITAEDNISGTGYIAVRFDDSDIDKCIELQLSLNESTEKWEGYLDFDVYFAAGKYTVSYLWVNDKAGNETCYHGKGCKDYSSLSPKLPSALASKAFTVVNDNSDYGPPTVTGITLSKTSVTAPGQVKVTIAAEDDCSGVETAGVSFRNTDVDKNLFIYTNYNQNTGKWEGYFDIGEYYAAGKYMISHVYITDKAGHNAYYLGKGYKYDSSSSPKLPSSLASKAFTVINDKSDTEPPTVIGITLNKTYVTVPCQIKVTFTVEDDYSGADTVQAYFRSSDKNLYVNTTFNKNTGKWVGYLDLDEYSVTGKYTIYYVVLKDKEGNQISYYGKGDSHYSSESNKLPSTLASKSFTAFDKDDVAITTQPKNVTVVEGEKATFNVKAFGTGLSYAYSGVSWTLVPAVTGQSFRK